MERTNLTTAATGQAETSQVPCKLARNAGEVVDIGSTRIRFLVRSPETASALLLIECPNLARTVVAPVHRHAWEDEYSFVLWGRAAALPGDDVTYAEAANSYSSRAGSGTPSGIQATNHAGSSRPSPQEASSTSSMSSRAQIHQPIANPLQAATSTAATEPTPTSKASKHFAPSMA